MEVLKWKNCEECSRNDNCGIKKGKEREDEFLRFLQHVFGDNISVTRVGIKEDQEECEHEEDQDKDSEYFDVEESLSDIKNLLEDIQDNTCRTVDLLAAISKQLSDRQTVELTAEPIKECNPGMSEEYISKLIDQKIAEAMKAK